jgi:hypothetical protein
VPIYQVIMAKRRDIKRDVNNLCYEVVYECMIFLEHTPSLNQENVYQIIYEAVDLRNELVNRVNHPEVNNSPSARRDYYREIREDLFNGTISMIERLNSLPR